MRGRTACSWLFFCGARVLARSYARMFLFVAEFLLLGRVLSAGAHMQKLPEVPWPTVLQGRPLAFDVGFFNGRDTLEFLRAGHRVVAVEANPSSYQHGLDTFASFINAGQLRMVNALVSRDEAANGTRPFYVHHEKADWARCARVC